MNSNNNRITYSNMAFMAYKMSLLDKNNLVSYGKKKSHTSTIASLISHIVKITSDQIKKNLVLDFPKIRSIYFSLVID